MQRRLSWLALGLWVAAAGCARRPPDEADGVARGASTVGGMFDVLTRNYNDQRTGWNANELALWTGVVNPRQFGKLFEFVVDDKVYAQPLFRQGLSVNGAPRNVLFVATANNSVYAFDVDARTMLWTTNLNGAGRPTLSNEVGPPGYKDFSGPPGDDRPVDIGIVGTPVINYNTNTMYLVTRTVEPDGATHQRLRALDITDNGRERANSGNDIFGTYVINPSTNVMMIFDAKIQNQRPGLALGGDSSVYVAWASYGDNGFYHGWVMSFDATTLALRSTFVTTPTG